MLTDINWPQRTSGAGTVRCHKPNILLHVTTRPSPPPHRLQRYLISISEPGGRRREAMKIKLISRIRRAGLRGSHELYISPTVMHQEAVCRTRACDRRRAGRLRKNTICLPLRSHSLPFVYALALAVCQARFSSSPRPQMKTRKKKNNSRSNKSIKDLETNWISSPEWSWKRLFETSRCVLVLKWIREY